MIVSELAEQAGVSAQVVRYYTRIGLLKPSRHPENGYKLFKRDDVHRVHFIRQAKQLGFKLKEIEDLLVQAYQGETVCQDVRKILIHRVDQYKSEIVELQQQLQHMENTLQKWEHISDDAPNHKILCPLIESECDH